MARWNHGDRLDAFRNVLRRGCDKMTIWYRVENLVWGSTGLEFLHGEGPDVFRDGARVFRRGGEDPHLDVQQPLILHLKVRRV